MFLIEDLTSANYMKWNQKKTEFQKILQHGRLKIITLFSVFQFSLIYSMPQ